MVLFLLGREHTSHRDAERDYLEEAMNVGLIKRSSMLDVDVGATASVELLIKSFDNGFNSLILVLWVSRMGSLHCHHVFISQSKYYC